MRWPQTFAELERQQRHLAAAAPPAWEPAGALRSAAGCFVCFGRPQVGPGAAGEPAWAAAAIVYDGGVRAAVIPGRAGAAYRPGLLALREGALLEEAVRALPARPEVLLVNATGRDHPRRAGLALHLGAMLEIPSVGVTHRPLRAQGQWPDPLRGARSPLLLDGERVGYWVVTREAARPLAAHAGWRTSPEAAARVVSAASGGWARTPEPIRQARRAARAARTHSLRAARPASR